MPAVHRVYGPEEKFREISVFPQSQDVLRKNHPVLKPNLVWEPYNKYGSKAKCVVKYDSFRR